MADAVRSVAASRPSGLSASLVSSLFTYTRLPCSCSPYPPHPPSMSSLPPSSPSEEKVISTPSELSGHEEHRRRDGRIKRWSHVVLHHLRKHTGLGAICAVAYFDPCVYVLFFSAFVYALCSLLLRICSVETGVLTFRLDLSSDTNSYSSFCCPASWQLYSRSALHLLWFNSFIEVFIFFRPWLADWVVLLV